MNKILISIIPMSALLLLSACTQDVPGGQGNELPYGAYPLQIGGITLDVESSAKPWSVKEPQTRVAEDKNGGKSSAWEWNGTERIGVQIGSGESGIYVLKSVDNNKVVEAETPYYWTNTDPAAIIAWYPVEVYNYTQCTHDLGMVSTDDGNKGWIKMAHPTYIDGTECWEANVVPDVPIDLSNFIRLNGLVILTAENFSDFIDSSLSAGEMYTINLTVDGSSL